MDYNTNSLACGLYRFGEFLFSALYITLTMFSRFFGPKKPNISNAEKARLAELQRNMDARSMMGKMNKNSTIGKIMNVNVDTMTKNNKYNSTQSGTYTVYYTKTPGITNNKNLVLNGNKNRNINFITTRIICVVRAPNNEVTLGEKMSPEFVEALVKALRERFTRKLISNSRKTPPPPNNNTRAAKLAAARQEHYNNGFPYMHY